MANRGNQATERNKDSLKGEAYGSQRQNEVRHPTEKSHKFWESPKEEERKERQLRLPDSPSSPWSPGVKGQRKNDMGAPSAKRYRIGLIAQAP